MLPFCPTRQDRLPALGATLSVSCAELVRAITVSLLCSHELFAVSRFIARSLGSCPYVGGCTNYRDIPRRSFESADSTREEMLLDWGLQAPHDPVKNDTLERQGAQEEKSFAGRMGRIRRRLMEVLTLDEGSAEVGPRTRDLPGTLLPFLMMLVATPACVVLQRPGQPTLCRLRGASTTTHGIRLSPTTAEILSAQVGCTA